MSKRILYCASTASHILNFHLPYLRHFKDQGWYVDVVVGDKAEIPYADNVIVVPLKKSMLAVSNLKTVYLVKCLLQQKQYDIISIHTTLAGAVVRLAVKLIGNRYEKVVYTSHGYLFSGKGELLENLYLLVEKYLASVTDVLMVMNNVDYQLAVRHKLCRKIWLIPGMGLDLNRFTKVDKEEKQQLKTSAGFNSEDILIVYAAEMSKRKNHGELLRAFVNASIREPSMRLLLAGDGVLRSEYEQLVNKLGLTEKIRFLGHVTDMPQLYKMCDIAVTTSRSEGLPFNVMEAMASGLPVLASKIKGHIDLLGRLSEELQVQCLYDISNEQSLTKMILGLCQNEKLREKVGNENRNKVGFYDLEKVKPVIVGVYEELIT